ncbi:MAG: glycosyltransferase family 39 protein [Acidimicrobiales bacterium]
MRAPTSWLRQGVLAAVAVAICWALISVDFAIVAAFVIAATFLYRADPGRPVAFGAFIVLVGAAVATVLEVVPGANDPTLTFAANRPLAGNAGNVAAALLAVAVVLFAVVERPVDRAARWRPARRAGAVIADARRRLAADRSLVLAGATIGVVALAIRVVAAPPPLSTAAQQITRNLRSGSGYLTVIDGRAVLLTDHPPLAPLVGAFAPGGPRLVQLVVGVLAVALVWRLARRIAGPSAALVAGTVAAVAPALWDQQLPMVLAGAALVGAVLLADPERLDGRRAVAGGLALAAAGLARPEALVAVPVVAAWVLLVDRHRDEPPLDDRREPEVGRGSRGALVAVLVAVPAVAFVPWVRVVASAVGLPLPLGSLGALVAEPGAAGRLPSLLGAAAGLVLVVLTLLAVGRDLDGWLDRGRRWLPVLVLPAAALAVGAISGGRAGLLGWGAPLATVVVGVGFADLVPRRPVVRTPGDRAEISTSR